MPIVDITGLDKAELLAALFNNSRIQGRGFMQEKTGIQEMSKADAQAIIDQGRLKFDYLQGRVMKLDLSGNGVETWLYNRDNGPNKAEEAIEAVRRGDKVYSGLQIPRNETEKNAQALSDAEGFMQKIFGQGGSDNKGRERF